MPLAAVATVLGLISFSAMALGVSLKWTGEGVEDTADGLSKLIVVSAVAGGVYVLAKKTKVI